MDARAGRLVDAPRYLASLVAARGRLRLLGGCLDAWPGRSAHGAGPGLPSGNLGPAITHRIDRSPVSAESRRGDRNQTSACDHVAEDDPRPLPVWCAA